MSGLKFTLDEGTSFLPDNLSGLKKYIYSGLRQSHEFSGNKQMQMLDGVTTEEFSEVAIESSSEWDLNSRPLISVQMLKPTELLYIYIHAYII